jgi:hypothetical protein
MQLIELFMRKQRDTEVRIFNRSGHFVMREHPGAFNRLIDTAPLRQRLLRCRIGSRNARSTQ